MPVDAQLFRHVMAHFVTGVTVVTMNHGPRTRGMTANAFCAVSLAPPLVLICVVEKGETNKTLREAGHFAVNILRADQQDLANRFSGRQTDDQWNFSGVALRAGEHGTPVIADCLAYAECRISAAHAAGDHTIFVGEMIAGDVMSPNEAPLAYYARRYRDLLLESEAEEG